MDGIQVVKKGHKLFRFEKMWTKDDECSNIINGVWSTKMNDGTIGTVMYLIQQCGLWLS